MSCFGVNIRILDSLYDASVKVLNDLSVTVSLIKQYVCSSLRTDILDASDFDGRIVSLSGSLKASIRNANTGLSVQVATICTPDVSPLYLEIEPEILWVYQNMENTNQVYSNVDWNII